MQYQDSGKQKICASEDACQVTGHSSAVTTHAHIAASADRGTSVYESVFVLRAGGRNLHTYTANGLFCINLSAICHSRAREMVQQLRTLVALGEDLDWLPSTHMMAYNL